MHFARQISPKKVHSKISLEKFSLKKCSLKKVLLKKFSLENFSPQDLPGSNMGDTECLDVCADSSSNETTNCHNLNFYCHQKIINKTQILYTGDTEYLDVCR